MAEVDSKLPDRIQFHYLKSQLWRVIHVDGAIGGITPRGMVHVALYSERPAIPQATEHEISPEGKIGAQHVLASREGVVRELDVDLVMTKQSAMELRDWLAARIGELEKMEADFRKKGNQ